MVGEAVAVALAEGKTEGIREIFEPSSKFCCEYKTTLQSKAYFKKVN